MFGGESRMQVLGILRGELVVEEALHWDLGALVCFRVSRLAVRADKRSITVIFQAECLDLA